MVVMEGLEYSPKLYERETKTIKYKIICLSLELDLTNCAVIKQQDLPVRDFWNILQIIYYERKFRYFKL